MSTPNQLKSSFEQIFKRQKLIENDPSFKQQKNAYGNINLESKYDLSTVSEIFQDPDLLSRISKEVYSFRAAKVRQCRARLHSKYIVKKKPQAKDVSTNRVISDDELEQIKSQEYQVNGKDQYLTPIASRKRKYFARDYTPGEQSSQTSTTDSRQEPCPSLEEESSQQSIICLDEESNQSSVINPREESSQTSITHLRDESSPQSATSYREESSQSRGEYNEEMDQLRDDDYNQLLELAESLRRFSEEGTETTIDDSTSDHSTNQMNISNQNLVLPAISISDNVNTVNKPKEDEFPLEKELKETAALYEESILKTAGPDYLYTLLPRQWETGLYKYVKENFDPTGPEIKSELEFVKDTLLTISIFDPLTAAKKYQEIEILGSQNITNFRDAVYCLNDFSNNRNKHNKKPDGRIVNSSKEKLSPSMVYIDHVFYIDTRSDVDPSYYDKLIDNWLTKKKVDKNKFSFTKKSMEILFENIPVKIHTPYVFIHQDKCEHMILIQCVRLIGKNEYQSKNEFPRTTHNLQYDRLKCNMCTIFPATKMTEEEIITGFSPCYYCDDCFDAFHNENNMVVAKDYCGSHTRKRH